MLYSTLWQCFTGIQCPLVLFTGIKYQQVVFNCYAVPRGSVRVTVSSGNVLLEHSTDSTGSVRIQCPLVVFNCGEAVPTRSV